MAALGRRSVIFRPIMIANPRYISIGARTSIRDHARLEIVLRPDVTKAPHLKIGDNVNIEQGVHIVCQGEVLIEDDVSITPYCAIVDTDHPFDDPDRPPKIGARLNNLDTHVRIGSGTFVGTRSVILPGVDIGRGCVIGAGSIVTSSVPDYSLVTGAPARVIKRFDTEARVWLPC